MTQMMMPPGTVLVVTPADMVPQVLALIGAAPVGAETGEEEVQVPGQGPWTRSMAERLVDELTYPLALELFDACAAQPDTWLPKSVVDESAHPPMQLRNELGAVSKAAKRLFGGKTWPLEYRRSRQGYHYRMPAQTAAWWRDARNA